MICKFTKIKNMSGSTSIIPRVTYINVYYLRHAQNSQNSLENLKLSTDANRGLAKYQIHGNFPVAMNAVLKNN